MVERDAMDFLRLGFRGGRGRREGRSGCVGVWEWVEEGVNPAPVPKMPGVGEKKKKRWNEPRKRFSGCKRQRLGCARLR